MRSIPKHHLSSDGIRNSFFLEEGNPLQTVPIDKTPLGLHRQRQVFRLPMGTLFFFVNFHSSWQPFPIQALLAVSYLPILHKHLLHNSSHWLQVHWGLTC